MKRPGGARLGAAALAALVAGALYAAPPARELHGAADAFAADGIAIAWGVLRAANDDDTAVVVRVEPDPQRFAAIEIVGNDPFGGRETTLLAPTAVGGPFELKVPRRQFADYPRTEFKLRAKGEATPALVVYFLGVPDTTPEATRSDELERSLAARLARARGASQRRTP
jgi:hypothetical protein